MAKHFDVCNARTGVVLNAFYDLKDAEVWIAEQETPELLEVIPVEVHDCGTPMNLFLSHGTLTKNK